MFSRPGAEARRCFMYPGSSSFLKEIVSSDAIKVKKPVRIKPITT
jgi:hypothetical protein